MVAVKEFSWEEISGPDFGNPARHAWHEAVAQVEEQLRATLRVEVLPERMRKALELVRANAVTLHADGTASVTSGKQTYTLAPDCPCADAKHRTELCKHTLAVELHRRALVLLEGTAPAPAAALWGTTEAPASCNIKLRVGNMELMYTARDIDDATLQAAPAGRATVAQRRAGGMRSELRGPRRRAGRAGAPGHAGGAPRRCDAWTARAPAGTASPPGCRSALCQAASARPPASLCGQGSRSLGRSGTARQRSLQRTGQCSG